MSSFPTSIIAISALPIPEQEDAWHLAQSISRLDSYISQYQSALSLFIFSSDLRRQTLLAIESSKDQHERIAKIRAFMSDPSMKWTGIAHRDSAMSIYHFKCILDGISFRGTPTLAGWVDHKALAVAKKKFNSAFQFAEQIRHSISHSGEMIATRDDVEKNSTSQEFEGSNLTIKGGSTLLHGVEDGEKYISTWYDKTTKTTMTLTSECNEKSLSSLRFIRDHVAQAFEPAAAKSIKLRVEQLSELKLVRKKFLRLLKARSSKQATRP